MNWFKLLGYGIAALVGLFVVSVVVNVVLGVIGFLYSLVSLGITLAVAGAIVYGAYRLYAAVSGDSSNSRSRQQPSESPWETETEPRKSPTERYVDGEISEEELERELELETN